MPSSHSHHRRRRREEAPRETARPPDRADVWLFVTVCYALSLLFLTHIPLSSLPKPLHPAPGDDVLIHGIAYFILAGLLCRTFDAHHKRRFPNVNPPILWYVLICAGCLVFGYLDEQTQPLVGRMADDADWQADALGAAFGVCAHLVFEIFFVPEPERPIRRRRRRRRRRSDSPRHEEGGHRRRRRRRRSHENEPRLPESGLAGADTIDVQPDSPVVPGADGRHPDSKDEGASRRRRKRRRRRRSDRGGEGESPPLR